MIFKRHNQLKPTDATLTYVYLCLTLVQTIILECIFVWVKYMQTVLSKYYNKISKILLSLQANKQDHNLSYMLTILNLQICETLFLHQKRHSCQCVQIKNHSLNLSSVSIHKHTQSHWILDPILAHIMLALHAKGSIKYELHGNH